MTQPNALHYRSRACQRWTYSDIACTFSDRLAKSPCVKSTILHSPRKARRPARHDTAEATLRIGATLALPNVLESLGANPAELLREAGFDLDLFASPENRISLAARGRLLAHCVARTGCPHLGLLVGQQGDLHSLGLVGLLVKYSADVGTALHSLVRYSHLHVGGAATTLAVDGESVALGFAVYQPRVEATDQVTDAALALLFNGMRTLCGPEWKPVEVRLAHRRPDDVGPYRRCFRAPLRFDAEQNALLFSARWLTYPLPAADSDLRRLLQAQIDALEVRHGDDFAEQIRSVLRSALVTGNAQADRVAALFSMHSRTLHRRLTTAGSGFRQLMDETRFEIARQILENSAMEVSQIASLLDYADASAFTRAFRRWSGTTPARWRATRDRAA